MNFTPQQVRQILSIPQETLRHWRTTLPPLSGKKGYSPCFSAGDILALRIVKEIVDKFRIRVQVLVPNSVSLFNTCKGVNWGRTYSQFLVFDPNSSTQIVLQKADDLKFTPLNSTVMLIPLDYFVEELKSLFAGERNSIQTEMLFPPHVVKRSA
jgi:hypothetical protein